MTRQCNLYDARLYTTDVFPGIPRVGRIFPQSLWPEWKVTADLPPEKNVIAQANAAKGCPIIYFDEFNHPAWEDKSPEKIQATMDRRAALTEIVHRVVGPEVRLIHYGWPVYGDMALRNAVLPWLWKGVEGVQASCALRCQFDVINDRPVASKLASLLGGAGVGVYWNGDAGMYLHGVTDAQAFSDCCDMALRRCRAANLPAVAMVRIVSPDARISVPEEICRIAMSKFQDVIVWEDETVPPGDAPMLKIMQAYGA